MLGKFDFVEDFLFIHKTLWIVENYILYSIIICSNSQRNAFYTLHFY